MDREKGPDHFVHLFRLEMTVNRSTTGCGLNPGPASTCRMPPLRAAHLSEPVLEFKQDPRSGDSDHARDIDRIPEFCLLLQVGGRARQLP